MNQLTFLENKVDRIHLELTNKCTLKCPKCSRTGSQVVKRPGHFPPALISQLFPWKGALAEVTLCGNYGDAIYHPKFHSILKELKSYGARIELTTNGSHRNQAWWQETASILTQRDRITFSIDGLADTNAIYRVGSDWDSIMLGIASVVGKMKTRWKMIVFRHNEHQIESARKLAQNLGVNTFRVNKSARFKVDKHDPLRPVNAKWIGLRSKNATPIKRLLKDNNRRELAALLTLRPQCLSGHDIFVAYDAKVFPCCACSMYETSPYARDFQNMEIEHTLGNRNLDLILSDPYWQTLARQWKSPEKAPASCIKRCGVMKEFETALADAEYIAKPKCDNVSTNLSTDVLCQLCAPAKCMC